MSFTVSFAFNRAPYNQISKPFSSALDVSGDLREETSIVDPEILIQYAGVLTAYNYAYISAFQRYYFIRNIESFRTSLWKVSMHCDVLKTFSQGILGSPAIIRRSSNNFNMYLDDPHYKCEVRPMVMTKTFPSGFDTSTASYVLALVGEAVPESSGE